MPWLRDRLAASCVDRPHRRRFFAEWCRLFTLMARYEALALVPHDSAQQLMAGVLLPHVSQFASVQTQEPCGRLHCVEGKPAVMLLSFDLRSCLSRFCPTPSLRLDASSPTRELLTSLCSCHEQLPHSSPETHSSSSS